MTLYLSLNHNEIRLCVVNETSSLCDKSFDLYLNKSFIQDESNTTTEYYSVKHVNLNVRLCTNPLYYSILQQLKAKIFCVIDQTLSKITRSY